MLTNQERMLRCQKAIAVYSDDDIRTNLVDFLADAMHLCHINDWCFPDALDTAQMHFDAELNGDDITEDFARQSTKRSDL